MFDALSVTVNCVVDFKLFLAALTQQSLRRNFENILFIFFSWKFIEIINSLFNDFIEISAFFTAYMGVKPYKLFSFIYFIHNPTKTIPILLLRFTKSFLKIFTWILV
jgi:hypothetical protein